MLASHYQVTLDINRRSDKGSILQSRLFRPGHSASLDPTDSLSFLAVDQETLDEYELTQSMNAEYT
jgi:hypothetical protein